MTKKKILFLCLIIIIGFFCFLRRELYSNYYAKIPVSFHYSLLKPLIKVSIEKSINHFLVDLGSSHEFTFEHHLLEKIKSKKKLEEIKIGDLKRNTYTCETFQIPKLKLGNIPFFNAIVLQQNHEFLQNTQVWQSSKSKEMIKNRIAHIDGKIGLPVFQDYNCLFDFPNSIIVLYEKTEKPVDFVNNFASIPFTMEKCGIVLSIETDSDSLKMALDTGATYSVIRDRENLDNIRAITKGSNEWYYETNHLKIGGYDFGPWEFALFNFSKELDIDGCLGADFFLEYVIYLDFDDKKAYIKKPEKYTLLTQWKRLKTRTIQKLDKLFYKNDNRFRRKSTDTF